MNADKIDDSSGLDVSEDDVIPSSQDAHVSVYKRGQNVSCGGENVVSDSRQFVPDSLDEVEGGASSAAKRFSTADCVPSAASDKQPHDESGERPAKRARMAAPDTANVSTSSCASVCLSDDSDLQVIDVVSVSATEARAHVAPAPDDNEDEEDTQLPGHDSLHAATWAESQNNLSLALSASFSDDATAASTSLSPATQRLATISGAAPVVPSSDGSSTCFTDVVPGSSTVDETMLSLSPPPLPSVDSAESQLQDTVCVHSADDSDVSVCQLASPSHTGVVTSSPAVVEAASSISSASRRAPVSGLVHDARASTAVTLAEDSRSLLDSAAHHSSHSQPQFSTPLFVSPHPPTSAVESDTVGDELRRIWLGAVERLRASGYTCGAMRHIAFTFQRDRRYVHVGFDANFDGGEVSLRRNSSSTLSTLSTAVSSSSSCSTVCEDSSGGDQRPAAGPSAAAAQQGSEVRASIMSAGTVSTIDGRGARVSVTSSLDHMTARSAAERRGDARQSVIIEDEHVHDEDARASSTHPPPPPAFPRGGRVRFADAGVPSAVSTLIGDVTRQSDSLADTQQLTGSSDATSHVTSSSQSSDLSVVSPPGNTGCLSELEETQLSDAEQLALRTASLQPDMPCFALWSDGCYYPGRVARATARHHRWLVVFDDGTRREVPEAHVLPVSTLWRGQSVCVMTEGDFYDAAIITGHRVTAAGRSHSKQLEYVVSVDNLNVTRAVPRSSLLLTRDQAADMQRLRASLTAAVGGGLPDSPARHAVTLDNLVDGRRVRRCLSGLEQSSGENDLPAAPSTPTAAAAVRDSVSRGRRGRAGHVRTPTTPRRSSRRTAAVSSPATTPRRRALKKPPVSARTTASAVSSHDQSDTSATTTSETSSRESARPLVCWSSYFPLQQFDLPRRSLFADMSFVLTCSSGRGGGGSGSSRVFNRNHVAEYIRAAGGVVLHSLDTLAPPLHGLILLLSDRALRTEKYISCLAACVPCVHIDWLVECVRAGSRLPHQPHLLPAAETADGQAVRQTSSAAALPLRSLCVGVADSGADGDQWVSLMLRVTASLGAEARLVSGDPATADCPFPVDVLVTQSSSPPAVVRWAVDLDIAVVSGEWAIACVIHRCRLGFNERPEFQCEVDID